MSYTIEKSEEQILVTIQHELTVAEVSGFRNALHAAAGDLLPVVVDAKDAKRIDISILQVLYAVRKLTGKLTMRDCSSGVRDYLARAGVTIDLWADSSSVNETLANGECNG